jgi:hypothetical protein
MASEMMLRRIRKVRWAADLYQDCTYWTAKQSLADIHALDTARITGDPPTAWRPPCPAHWTQRDKLEGPLSASCTDPSREP